MAAHEPQGAPAPHEFAVKQFDGSRAQHAGCTGCAWVGPFVYDRTAEEREQLSRTFDHKHRTTPPAGPPPAPITLGAPTVTAEAKYLQVVEANHEENAFHVLGGAGFTTHAETMASFNSAPTAQEQAPGDMRPGYVLDVLDDDLNVIEDKIISAATAREFLGADLDTLREKAKADEAIVQERIARGAAAWAKNFPIGEQGSDQA